MTMTQLTLPFPGVGRCSMAAALGFLAAGLMTSAVKADVLLDFSLPEHVTDNFVRTRPDSAGSFYHSANHGGYVFAQTSSTSNLFRYDPGHATAGDTPDVFLTDSVSVDFWHSLAPNSNPFMSIAARIDGSSAVLATVQFVTASEIQLRFSYGASMATGGLGTYFYQAAFDLSATPAVTNIIGSGGTAYSNGINISGYSTGTTWSSILPMTLELEQTADHFFRLTMSDAQGPIATTDWQELLARTDLGHDASAIAQFQQAGSVGLRMSSGANNTRWGVDNFAVEAIPEPGTVSVLAGLTVGLLWRRRRA